MTLTPAAARCLVAALFALGLAWAPVAGADGGIPLLTTDTFANAIKDASHPVLIEFKAKWCPYCKKEQPDIESLRLQRMGTLDIYQVDIDEEPNIAADYNAHILPTMIILDHGIEVGRSEGALYGDDLSGWVKDVESDMKSKNSVESDSPQPM